MNVLWARFGKCGSPDFFEFFLALGFLGGGGGQDVHDNGLDFQFFYIRCTDTPLVDTRAHADEGPFLQVSSLCFSFCYSSATHCVLLCGGVIGQDFHTVWRADGKRREPKKTSN